jgi:alkanesulfonate monooxygenase SsuD/methylene tetrahydromethanopterin reductase-like flavin-dependent oxidoreductase (luciferase family)
VNGKIPLMVGGDTDIALKRVARASDGWLCFSVAVDEMSAKVSRVKELTREQGRDPEALRISKAIFSWTTHDELARYREAGVTEFLLFKCGELSPDDAELNAQLAQAGHRFVDAVADW